MSLIQPPPFGTSPPLVLHEQESLEMFPAEPPPRRSLVVPIALAAISIFIAVLLYLISEQAKRTSGAEQLSARNAHEIVVISETLKKHSDALKTSEQTANSIVKNQIRMVQLYDGRLSQIESSSDSLKANLQQLVRGEARLEKRIELLAARLPVAPAPEANRAPKSIPPTQQPTTPTQPAVPAAAPGAAAPSNQNHNHESAWLDEAPAPPGTVVINNEGHGVNWLIQKDGKLQYFRPFDQTTLGIFVHCLSDGKDYIISPTGEWVGEAN